MAAAGIHITKNVITIKGERICLTPNHQNCSSLFLEKVMNKNDERFNLFAPNGLAKNIILEKLNKKAEPRIGTQLMVK